MLRKAGRRERVQSLDWTSHQCNAAFQCKLAEADPKQDSELQKRRKEEEMDEERCMECEYKHKTCFKNVNCKAKCFVFAADYESD